MSSIGSDDRDALRVAALRRSGLLQDETFAQFDRLTELASRLIGAPVALVSMVDTDRQYFTSQHGLPQSVADARSTPLDQSVCALVVDDDAPLIISAMSADDRFADHPARDALDVGAYCGVPIRDRNGFVLGSFCVIDDQAHEWTEETVELLIGFAQIVGDYVQTSSDHQRLVTDLQLRLLPTESPTLAAGSLDFLYRSLSYSDAIGGDFYDWHMRPDGTLDLIIGDVVGHGVGSTQAAAQLRSAARAVFSGSTTSPADAVRRISAACAELPGCACAALTVARVSADGANITWVRAGALPPLLVSSQSQILDGPAGAPLGVATWTAALVNEVSIESGESVIFFTDGLVERGAEHLDTGLTRALAATRSGVDLPGFVDAVCPPDTQTDDVAVLRFTRR